MGFFFTDLALIYCMLRGDMVMMFYPTFNNISVISWRSVLLLEETGVPRRKPPTYRKSLTDFITYCCIEYTSPERYWNSQLQW